MVSHLLTFNRKTSFSSRMSQEAADTYALATDDSDGPGWYKMGSQVFNQAKYRLTADDKRRQAKYIICPTTECQHDPVSGTQCPVCMKFMKLTNDDPVTPPQCTICEVVMCRKSGGYSCECKKYFIEGTGTTCGGVICNTLFVERVLAHLLMLEKNLVVPGVVKDLHMTAEIVRGADNIKKAECYKCFEPFSVFWKYSSCSGERHPYVLEEGGIVPDRLAVVQNEFTDWVHPRNLSKELPQGFLLHSNIIGYCAYSTVSVRGGSHNRYVATATIMTKNRFKRAHEAFEKEALELLAKQRRLDSIERREAESSSERREEEEEEDEEEEDSDEIAFLNAVEQAIALDKIKNKKRYE